jgi:cell division septation protein DedD
VGPAAPRLRRDHKRRFLWSAVLGVAFFAAFGVAAWWSGSGASEAPPRRPGPPLQAQVSGPVAAMPSLKPPADPATPQAPESPREIPAAAASAGSGESPAPPVVMAEADRNQATGNEGTTAEKAVEKTTGEPEEASGSKEGPANPSQVPQGETSQAPAPTSEPPATERASQTAAGPVMEKVAESGVASPGSGESPQAAGAPAAGGEGQGRADTGNTTPATTTAPTPAAPPQEAEAAKRAAWTVCAASFRRESMAQNYAQRLAGQGLAARVSRADLGEKGVWYRVCLGGFASLAEAKRQYQAWEEQGLISDAFLLPLR